MNNGRIELKCALSDHEIAMESLLALSAHWHLNGWPMRTFAAGHFVLLDTLQNGYFCTDELTEFGVRECAYILHLHRDAVQPVTDHIAGVDSPHKWERMVDAWPAVTAKNMHDTAGQLQALLEYAQAGYEMIDVKGDSSTVTSGHYDAHWLATVVSSVQSAWPGTTADDVIWEMPLIMVGHCVAVTASQAGEHVERPVDYTQALRGLRKNNG